MLFLLTQSTKLINTTRKMPLAGPASVDAAVSYVVVERPHATVFIVLPFFTLAVST